MIPNLVPVATSRVKPLIEVGGKKKNEVHIASPVSHRSSLLSSFLDLHLIYPPFPFEIKNQAILDRLDSLPGRKLLDWVIEKIGSADVLEYHFVGSAINDACKNDFFLDCLALLNLPAEMKEDIAKLIVKRTNEFKDVDYRIRVDSNVDLFQLAETLNKTTLIQAVYRAEDRSLLIIPSEQMDIKVDIWVYTGEISGYAFCTDNLRINLKTYRIESDNPWGWWRGQVFRVIDLTKSGNRHLFMRLVDKEVNRYTTTKGTEFFFYDLWDPNEYKRVEEVSVQQLFKRLTVQRICLEHCKDQSQLLFLINQTSQVNGKITSNRFLSTFFDALNSKNKVAPYLHAIVRLIAAVALRERWKKLRVKLLKHEDEWYLRMRLEGQDLLLKFQPYIDLSLLSGLDEKTWEYLKKVMHSLWLDGIELRPVDKNFRSEINKYIDNDLYKKLKQLFLHGVKSVSVDKFISSQQKTLAEFLIQNCTEPAELLWQGLEVLTNYDQPEIKRKLCWEAVENCLQYHGYNQAAELVRGLRMENIEPECGYELFFNKLLDGNCNESVLQTCNPYGFELAWGELAKADSRSRKQKLVELVDASEASDEEYLRIRDLTKVKSVKLSEARLTSIMDSQELAVVCPLIDRHDRIEYKNLQYCEKLSGIILGAIASLGYSSLTPTWIAAFLKSGRFIGEKKDVCSFLVKQDIDTDVKSELLRMSGIHDKDLWRHIVGEYLRNKGEWPNDFTIGGMPSETLSAWCTIIQNAEKTDKIIPIISKLDDEYGLKKVVLLHLLKGWGKKQIHHSVLTLLDTTKDKLPWEEIVKEANSPLDILTNLKEANRGVFNVFPALMSVVNPKNAEFLFSWWITKKMDQLEHEQALRCCGDKWIKECLMLNPKKALTFLKKIACPKTITFVIEVAGARDNIDKDLFELLLRASFDVNDHGKTTDYVLDNSPAKTIQNVELAAQVVMYADQLLRNPQGNLHAIGRLWALIPKIFIPKDMPPLAPSHRLLALSKAGYMPIVIMMLHESNSMERKKVEPKLYCEIVRKLQDSERKIELLSGCRVSSPALQDIWYNIAFAGEPRRPIRCKLNLVTIGHQVGIAADVVQSFAVDVLQNIHFNTDIELSLIDSVYQLLDVIKTPEIFKLWEALEKTGKISKGKLWSSALSIIKNSQNAPQSALVYWLADNINHGSSEEFFVLMQTLLPKLPEELTHKIANGFLKALAVSGHAQAKELFWKYTKGTSVTMEELEALDPNYEQTKLLLNAMIDRCKPNSENVKSILLVCRIYAACFTEHRYWADVQNMTRQLVILLIKILPFAQDENITVILDYVAFLSTHASFHKMQDAEQILLDNFEFLSHNCLSLITTAIYAEKYMWNKRWDFIKLLIDSGVETKIFLAVVLIEREPETIIRLDGAMFQRLFGITLLKEKCLKIIDKALNPKQQYIFQLIVFREELKMQKENSLPFLLIYIQKLIFLVKDDSVLPLKPFLPPLLHCIFQAKDGRDLLIFDKLKQGIIGRQNSIETSLLMLVEAKKTDNENIRIEIFEYVCTTLERERITKPEDYNLLIDIYKVLELASILVHTHDSLCKFIKRLSKARRKIETSPYNEIEIQRLFVATLMLNSEFHRFCPSMKLQVRFIVDIIMELKNYKTQSTVDFLQHIMFITADHVLYQFPDAFSLCNEIFLEAYLSYYSTDLLKPRLRYLFKHLVIQIPKDRAAREISICRFKVVLSTITRILQLHPQILPDLIEYIHQDIVTLYKEHEVDPWDRLIAILFKECSEQGKDDSYKSLAYLLQTRPSGVVRVERFPLDCQEIVRNIPLIVNCEERVHHLSRKKNVDVFEELNSIWDEFLDTLPEMVTSYLMKRSIRFIRELLKIVSEQITSNSKSAIEFLFRISSSVQTQRTDYAFGVMMSLAEIYRPEITGVLSWHGKLNLEEANFVIAESQCQLMKYVPWPQYKFPVPLFKVFIDFYFKQFLQEKHHAPAYIADSVRVKFTYVYIGALNGMLMNYKEQKDKPKFMSNLGKLEQVRGLISKIKIKVVNHFDLLLLLTCNHIEFLKDKELAEFILDLIYHNFSNFHPTISSDIICQNLAKFAVLAFMYGPDKDTDKIPNKFQRAAFFKSDQISQKSIPLGKAPDISAECMIAGASLRVITNGKFDDDTSLEIRRASCQKIEWILQDLKIDEMQTSDWYRCWKAKFNTIKDALKGT